MNDAPPLRRGRARFAAALFLANLAAVLLLWWLGSGSSMRPELADELNAFGRVTALAGTYLVLVQLVLRTHVTWLVGAFGKESLRSAHRWNAYLVTALLVAHGLAQLIAYALEDGVDLATELGRLIAHYEGMVAGIAGLLVLVAITIVAILPASHRLDWSAWRAIHLYAYIGVALSLPHQVVTGKDFAGATLAVAYWSALYATVIAVLAVARGPALWRAVRSAAATGLGSMPRAAAGAVAATAVALVLLASVRVTPVPIALADQDLEPVETATPTPVATVTGAPSATPPAGALAPTAEYVGDLVATPYGDAQVRAIFEDGRLVDVRWEVRPGIQRTSWQISDAALPYLSRRAVRAQSADIDVISGATYTSNAFKASLAVALREAGIGQTR